MRLKITLTSGLSRNEIKAAMENDGIIIRDASEDDLPAIHELEARSFSSPWSMEGLRRELSISFSHVLVAELDGSLAGYAVAWDVKGDINLNHLAVAEPLRRRGVGSALVRALMDRLAVRGGQCVYLEVGARNKGARAFYTRLGFRENGLRKNYYPDDDAVLMHMEIGK